MHSGELTFNGLIDTIAMTSAISEADLLAPQTFLNEGPRSDFQTIVAKGHLKTPSATVEIQLEAGDILFKESRPISRLFNWIASSTKK